MSTSSIDVSLALEELEVRKLIGWISEGYAKRDADLATKPYVEDIFLFDLPPPLASIGVAGNKKATQDYMDATEGPLVCEYSNIAIKIFPGGKNGYGRYFIRLAGKLKGDKTFDDGSSREIAMKIRVTDIFEKRGDRWWIVHEHASLPVNLATGRADFQAEETTTHGAKQF